VNTALLVSAAADIAVAVPLQIARVSGRNALASALENEAAFSAARQKEALEYEAALAAAKPEEALENEAALTEARRRLANVIHQRELGLDPAKKVFSPEEAATGTRLEQILGQKINRDPSGASDWIGRGGRTYDAVGPVPVEHFNVESFKKSIDGHLLKQGLDRVVVDMTGMPTRQTVPVAEYIATLSPAARARILKIGF
jgi:hypothetical protein